MSEPRTITIPLAPPQAVESTTAQLFSADDPDAAAIVLAHGAGTDMSHRHMQRHARDLARRGHPVVLFNFGYTQAGRKRPDPPARLESAWRDVIAAVRPALGEGRRLVIGGRSMGGRIASMVTAEDAAALGIDGVACIAYPLHPAGKPDKLRVDHWPALTVPILLVCGDRDAMAPVETLREQVAAHMPDGLATLHIVAGADHSYRVRKSDGRTEQEVLDEVADTISEWCASVPGA